MYMPTARDSVPAAGPTAPAPDAHPGQTYRPDIDGLRAIAVLAVVFFHTKLKLVSGGYVGVDIFFVISGYLITSILMADRRAGRLSIAAFYNRRIRRIFPALFVVAAACVVFAAKVFPPRDFAAFGQSFAAMALFASNIFFELSPHAAAGYFADDSQAQILLHTWSLAVEEQFYIVLPLSLVLMRRFDERMIFRIIAAVAVVSLLFSIWAVAHVPTTAFYNVASRAWELLLGSLLSMKPPAGVVARPVREGLSACGLVLILYAIFGFSPATPFPGAAALIPCLGAALLIHAGRFGTTIVGSALSTRPAVAIGLISYSLYLWHWPVLVMVRYLNVETFDAPSTAFAILLSIALAILTYRYVETPFRRGWRQASKRTIILAGVGVSVLGCALGGCIVLGNGLPGRFAPATLARIDANLQRQKDHPPGDCGNYEKMFKTRSDFTFCSVGTESRKIVIWGDSQADSLQPLIRKLHDDGALGGRGVVFALSRGCPPTPHVNKAKNARCDLGAQWSLERAEAPDVDTVFVMFAPWWEHYARQLCRMHDGQCVKPLSIAEAEDAIVDDVRASLAELKAKGKHIVLALPAPAYNVSIPKLEIEEMTLPSLMPLLRWTGATRLQRFDYPGLRKRIQGIADDLGLATFDPRRSLCSGGDCIYAKDGVSIYVDGGHIAGSQTPLLRDDLEAALR